MNNLLELTEVVAIGKSIIGDKLISIVFYDGKTIEWFYTEDEKLDRIRIYTSTFKIDGPNRTEGRLFFRNDEDRRDPNTFYLDKLSILNYDLFDLVE